MLLVCAAAWLEWRGLPRAWTKRVCAYLAENEWYTDMKAIRFQFPASVVVEGFRLFEAPNDEHPLVEADRLRFGWSPLTALRRRQNIATLRMRGATVTLRSRDHAGEDKPSIALQQLNLYTWFARDGFHLGLAEGSLGGIRIRGRAFIESMPRDPAAPRPTLRDVASALREVLAKITEWVPLVVSARRQVDFPSPPHVDFQFHAVPAEWIRSAGELKATGFRTTYRGVSFDRWKARVVLTNGVLDIPVLSAVQGSTRCVAQGQITLTNTLARFHVYSTLLPQTWLCFLPLTNLWADCSVECGAGSKSHFEIWLGPALLKDVARSGTGWAEIEKAVIRSVPVERFFGHVVARDDTLRLDYAELNLPHLRFAGEAGMNLESLEYEVEGTVTGDPRTALPWLPEGPADVIRELDNAQGLAVTGRVAGCFTNLQAFTIECRGHGDDFVFRGVDVWAFDAHMLFSNDVLELRDMVVQRPEGKVCGWVSMDFDHELLRYDVESSMHPHAMARIIGSNTYEFLSMFRFEGTASVRSRGAMDFGTFDKTDLQAEVDVTHAGWDRFLADKVRMRIEAQGRQVTFTNVQGTAYGGDFSGYLMIENIGSTSSPPRYDLKASVENADFNRFVSEVRGLTNQSYQGTLSATVSVAGAIGEGQGKTAEGAGTIRIWQGQLFRLPLLGGLSHFLSKIYPGLGFASQTDLTADFVIADGTVCSEDIELQGNMLSIQGFGCCSFDGQLDFVAQVKLLRRSYPAYVLRFVTFPVTKLLEFHLGGTADEPKWRPRNLPKELFLMFD